VADKLKNIVYLRPDTIGDLVIFSSALAQLQAAWPQARHTLVVRPGYETLAPLFSPELHWQVAHFNPFAQKPAACRRELAALLAALEKLQPDVIVAGTINRTWLELAVAAHFPKARRVALGARAVDPLFAAALRLELGVETEKAFNEIVPVDEKARDWENNHRLADQLAGRALPRTAPSVSVPPAVAAQADTILAEKKLPAGAWAAVFAAGLANVPIKAWPTARFAELVVWLQRERKLPVLLLGHSSEAAILESVGQAVGKLGGTKPAVWLGRDGEVPLLAALLRSAQFYVGHDTGAMHLAAAVGRPVVGIFGGGHWPRFRPVGRQTVSVVQPLPCFGCNWDCHFGDAPCVKTLTLADVRAAVEKILAAGSQPIDELVEAHNLPAETLQLIAASTPRYVELQRDRVDRQHKIEELKRETDTKDTEIASLKKETNFKDTEIAALKKETDTKDDEIAGLKKETDFKDTEIAALKIAATERKTEMEAIKAELEGECADKDKEIAELKAEADTKDAEIAALKQVCNERETLIFTLSGHIKNFQKTVADLNTAHGDKDRHIANLDRELAQRQTTAATREAEIAPRLKRLAELEQFYSRLPDPENSERIAGDFRAKDVHIANIEALVANREEELALVRAAIAEREQTFANVAAGFSGLEAAKYYGQLLAEKEAAIQTLHKACVEREAVIQQLAVSATGFGPRVAKLWTATSAHFRLKFWAPFNTWLFKKVVEDYWMQIGVLRHYEPRQLKWDQFPKARLPEEKLPQIGIVTPSYGQPAFIESTLLSVLNQNYPKLLYVVQDGGSPDDSPQIIARHADRLAYWESAKDRGQADAVRKGFLQLDGRLGPDDVMAWLNSDDFIAPRALRFVAEYFATHPNVDCIYGHRIIIDDHDREVGRWIMPRHDPRSLEWIDYVPQETLFWRKRAWDLVGGIDPSFQFALDWDLLARFTQAKLNIVRLPYFLGCFRVHQAQKTSAAIHTTGADEMVRVRTRFHGAENQADFAKINAWARRARFQGALTARLHALGVRW
jgi:ADP-heptose:LPS heptosyltransferase